MIYIISVIQITNNYKTKITKTKKYVAVNYLLSMSAVGTKTIVLM